MSHDSIYLQIEELDSYNPLMASSGLYQCLKNKNKKPEPKQQKRKTENVRIYYNFIYIFQDIPNVLFSITSTGG